MRGHEILILIQGFQCLFRDFTKIGNRFLQFWVLDFSARLVCDAVMPDRAPIVRLTKIPIAQNFHVQQVADSAQTGRERLR